MISHINFLAKFYNQSFETAADLPLWTIPLCSIVACLIMLCIGAVVLWKGNVGVARKLNEIALGKWFITVWVFGFMVYDVGMCTGEVVSLLANAPMAMLHAFCIFLLDSDVSEIQEPFFKNWLFMGCFSLAHASAALVSMLFVIRHFGFNAIARYKMYLEGKGKVKSRTYIFWGLNEPTYHLAESIKKHHEERDDNDYRIIIVRTNSDEEGSASERSGLAHIFDFLSLKTSDMYRLQSLNCLTIDTSVNLMNINHDLHGDNTPVDIIGDDLKLKSLKRIIARNTSRVIHMLFLSDDEKNNLHAVSMLRNDATIKAFAESGESGSVAERMIFHCHARYNSVHRVIEDQKNTNGVKVKVVDSSHINVEMLKQNINVLPVKFVGVEPDATVSTAFNALVVGFSEVGQDSVRFLYEFGAFVKSGSPDNNASRSDFHMHVVDKNMADLAGVFVANAPAIKLSMPFAKNSGDNSDALITLHQMDCRSVDFYMLLQTWIKDLNYVVVATDDDELNISLGVRIFKAATRYRDNMDRLCILVRAHSDDNGYIQNIASHYNIMWAAQTKNENLPAKLPIYLFGMDTDIYTYENIIDDTLERKAMEYKDKYEKSTTPKSEYKANDNSSDSAPAHTSYETMMRHRRTEGQNFANSLHEITKKELAAMACKTDEYKPDLWQGLIRKKGTITYLDSNSKPVNDERAKILRSLAQTEHLRWNASHEILGYVYDKNGKDEVRLHHGCLTLWENLNEETQSYDCNVVDISLGIITPDTPLLE